MLRFNSDILSNFTSSRNWQNQNTYKQSQHESCLIRNVHNGSKIWPILSESLASFSVTQVKLHRAGRHLPVQKSCRLPHWCMYPSSYPYASTSDSPLHFTLDEWMAHKCQTDSWLNASHYSCRWNLPFYAFLTNSRLSLNLVWKTQFLWYYSLYSNLAMSQIWCIFWSN